MQFVESSDVVSIFGNVLVYFKVLGRALIDVLPSVYITLSNILPPEAVNRSVNNLKFARKPKQRKEALALCKSLSNTRH